MKNKSTIFLAEAAAIGAIYVVLTLLFAPLSYGEVQIRFSEAPDYPALFHTGSYTGTVCRLYHCQSFRRCNSCRYPLRKYCHPDRRSFHLQAS